mmetsp:Transcript_8037/g.14993  ORF Transcript_8037/g.14993 Transcript_8037/m.14993 type:complete len:263 (-) Transcript_8037:1199-1987(-)
MRPALTSRSQQDQAQWQSARPRRPNTVAKRRRPRQAAAAAAAQSSSIRRFRQSVRKAMVSTALLQRLRRARVFEDQFRQKLSLRIASCRLKTSCLWRRSFRALAAPRQAGRTSNLSATRPSRWRILAESRLAFLAVRVAWLKPKRQVARRLRATRNSSALLLRCSAAFSARAAQQGCSRDRTLPAERPACRRHPAKRAQCCTTASCRSSDSLLRHCDAAACRDFCIDARAPHAVWQLRSSQDLCRRAQLASSHLHHQEAQVS